MGASLNPFVVLDDASGFIDFAVDVFQTVEHVEARTEMPDGRLIHAEVVMGGSVLMLCDRLEGWPARLACCSYGSVTRERYLNGRALGAGRSLRAICLLR